MGMVIVVGNAPVPHEASPSWKQYDLLPNPLGWLLVLTGLFALRRLRSSFGAATWAGLVAFAVSVPLWLPQVSHRLDAAGGWFASLPQVVCCLLLCRQVGVLAMTERDTGTAKTFGLLVWGFGLVGVLPVVAIGGDVTWLQGPTVVVALLVNVAFVWACFAVHRRPWLGGPEPATTSARGES